MWRKKRVIFAAITALAVLSVVFPYYNQTMLFLAFAPHHNQNTLVLDAGHGGIDGGAVSAAGVKESEINLAIARRLNSLAELYGVRTHMTRVDDSSKSAAEGYSEHEDLVRRVEEINSAPNGILISIHQNC